ncbi:MAG: IPTL-CTERM sorting domain-containing protein [Betaproteobacteria bacterium]|nr:IPTL-CTERM sorting domain-containing protein [Betaproteobacteria bacterium]
MRIANKGVAVALFGTALFFAVSASHAAFNISTTLSGAEPTINPRVFRDAIPSTCGGKVFPGTWAATVNYDVHTVYNNGPSRCVTVNVDVGTCATNVFVTAYTTPVNVAALATNYLGDQGSSITQPFSFVAPGNSSIDILVTSATSVVSTPCSYTISSAELDAGVWQSIPTLSGWGLALLSGLLGFGALALRRFRRF